MHAARDAVVNLPLQQPHDPKRRIGQGREAPLAGEPLVVSQNHERRYQRDEHERVEARSHGGQE